jgi:hypothetical protein
MKSCENKIFCIEKSNFKGPNSSKFVVHTYTLQFFFLPSFIEIPSRVQDEV